MKTSFSLSLLAFVLATALSAPFASANEDEFIESMKEMAGAFMAKAQSGATTEADYADEFQQLDQFFDAQADNPDHAAEVLSLKAMIYAEILSDPDRAVTLLETIAADYPGTKAAEGSKDAIAYFKEKEEADRMRKSLVVGATFPDFSVKDLDGNDLTLSDYRGKVVLLDFWATWCAPCISELPNVLAAYSRYHEEGFEIIGISLDEDREALERFLKQMKMPWPQYYDGKGWGNELSRKYGVQSIPATYLLNKDGKIIGSELRGSALGAAVATALGQ